MELSPLLQILFVGLGIAAASYVNTLRQGRKMNGVQNKQTTTQETIANLNSRITDLENDLKQVKLERDAANTVVGQLQAEMVSQRTEFQGQIKELTEANQAAQASVKQFRDGRDTSDARNKQLMEENAGLNASLAQQEREIRGLEKRVNELEHQLAVQQTVEKIVDTLADRLTGALEKFAARSVPESGTTS